MAWDAHADGYRQITQFLRYMRSLYARHDLSIADDSITLQGSKEEALLQQTFKASNKQDSSAARQGLMVMLRAKLPPARRQAVLKLVAYYAPFTQSLWLLVHPLSCPTRSHSEVVASYAFTLSCLSVFMMKFSDPTLHMQACQSLQSFCIDRKKYH